MRFTLAALVLGATVLLAVSGALAAAEEHQDPTIYMDRVVSSGSASAVFASGTARNPMDIYQELGQNERGGQ